jgi:hypothetical protein
MNKPAPAARHAALAAALGLALALPAMAQQTPITGRMMDGRNPAPAATPVATSAPMAPVATPDPSAPPPPPPADTPVAALQSADYAPAPAYASDDGADRAAIGYTTRQLLQMQASGSQAGNHLPMLGDEASASYRRYIQSFNHPIPEFYESTVGKNGSNSSGR